MDQLFAEVPVKIIVDDFFIHGGKQHELDDKMIAVLKRSRDIGLIKQNFEFQKSAT